MIFSDDKQGPLIPESDIQNDPDTATGFKDPENPDSSSLAVNREEGRPTGSVFFFYFN